ncbi:sensor domain-containing diguanylate cyclase [Domibacillus indicus]|uniref:sensor domain-containing diguanylate cyclase n=1 Tax=Domibacillus indicus TaxID=1437523 RepID=UPI00203DB03B|nr:sensor domain-containing diguanylate cyclase [Domibacillus indicus]MCM3789368.1 sensor domain-containing diguanylate cyclase [Domibacillus indicus]
MTLLTFVILGTFIGSAVSGALVSKSNLENNFLVDNEFYAQKLAATTDSLFKSMLQNLRVESQEEELLTKDTETIQHTLNTILNATRFFNTVWFIDETGHVVSTAPHMDLEGQKANRVGAREALKKRVPLISEPYVGLNGHLIMLVSFPVYDENGGYVGFLGGSINLDENNSLSDILGEHPQHESGSYVYVVDSKGNIIYHPDFSRISENVKDNAVIKKVLKGKDGSQEVVNSKGITMLAGYASSNSSAGHWGIVSQTPKEAILEPTIELAKKVSLVTFPFIVLMYILTYILLQKLVKPIRDLAAYTQQITENTAVTKPRIPDWYSELKELKRAVLIAFDFYEKRANYAENESNIDPLTGYFNRRYLEKTIQDLDIYSIILFDIDHFKKINDQYGHSVGDEVLKYVASLVQKETRVNDLCFRIGGEEFLIVLPDTGLETAQIAAERIRKTLETTNSPTGKPVTVSIGIGNTSAMPIDFKALLNMTDQALYRAKREGRNKVVRADDLKTMNKGASSTLN